MDEKKEIKICMGSACFALGNKEHVRLIENFIKENNLQTSLHLTGALCNNVCKNAPRVIVAKKEYVKVSEEELLKVLKEEFLKEGRFDA